VVAPFAGMADKEKKKEGGLKSRIQVLFWILTGWWLKKLYTEILKAEEEGKGWRESTREKYREFNSHFWKFDQVFGCFRYELAVTTITPFFPRGSSTRSFDTINERSTELIFRIRWQVLLWRVSYV
jgi:hypothetical protein